jgi:hypothetical protein
MHLRVFLVTNLFRKEIKKNKEHMILENMGATLVIHDDALL